MHLGAQVVRSLQVRQHTHKQGKRQYEQEEQERKPS
jgi:hypothetical protein